LSLCLTNYALRHEGVWGSGCIDQIFLTSALVGGEWSASRSGRFTARERTPGTHWIAGWVDPRAGLDDVEKIKFLILPGLELLSLGRPLVQILAPFNLFIYLLYYPWFISILIPLLILIYCAEL
jgi:hypothetical protein